MREVAAAVLSGRFALRPRSAVFGAVLLVVGVLLPNSGEVAAVGALLPKRDGVAAADALPNRDGVAAAGVAAVGALLPKSDGGVVSCLATATVPEDVEHGSETR